jgi:hypothetical protein
MCYLRLESGFEIFPNIGLVKGEKYLGIGKHLL